MPTNFGIQDQIAVLQWLHDIIGTFGGNPNKVTIAGQSAGSMAVHTLVASPLAAFFRLAIAQAGLLGPGLVLELEAAEKTGLTYRGKPTARMLNGAWLRARKRAGLPMVRVHDMKHTYGRAACGRRELRGPAGSARSPFGTDHDALFGR